MALDIALNENWDLFINENGDINLTNSIRQSVKVRLQWFLEEWKFAPDYGIPYFQELLKKQPNTTHISNAIRDDIASIDGVADVSNIDISIDSKTRKAKISLTVTTSEETFKEELLLNV